MDTLRGPEFAQLRDLLLYNVAVAPYRDLATLRDWHANLSFAVMIYLDGGDEGTAFGGSGYMRDDVDDAAVEGE